MSFLQKYVEHFALSFQIGEKTQRIFLQETQPFIRTKSLINGWVLPKRKCESFTLPLCSVSQHTNSSSYLILLSNF